MLHSPSSSTSPWLLRHTTSLLRWPTPHGTEHLRETGKWERRVGRRKGMCCFWAKTLHFSIIWKYKTCTPSALVKNLQTSSITVTRGCLLGVCSHRAPLRPDLPLAANLQLTCGLGHRPIRQPTHLRSHGDRSLRPIDGVSASDLAADDLAVLIAGSAPPAAL